MSRSCEIGSDWLQSEGGRGSGGSGSRPLVVLTVQSRSGFTSEYVFLPFCGLYPETGSHFVAQAGPQLVILPSYPIKCWDYRSQEHSAMPGSSLVSFLYVSAHSWESPDFLPGIHFVSWPESASVTRCKSLGPNIYGFPRCQDGSKIYRWCCYKECGPKALGPSS